LSANPGIRPRQRRIALFGGSFDPIHSGHLAIARAAQRRLRLDRIYFIPSSHPPHKRRNELLPFLHRFTMVALACAGHARFLPSLAEAEQPTDRIFYSVDTVRRFRRKYHRSGDRIFFLLGADSFLEIQTWKDYRTLLGLCDFVVVNRPGFPSDALRRVIPPELLAHPSPSRSPSRRARSIALRRTTVYLLDTAGSRVSATDVRRRLEGGQSIRGLVPARVEEYIKKQALYYP
jgi:nicotinate-nucleotide adenylyltransferase